MQGGPGTFRGSCLLRSDGQQGMAANGTGKEKKKACGRLAGHRQGGKEIIP